MLNTVNRAQQASGTTATDQSQHTAGSINGRDVILQNNSDLRYGLKIDPQSSSAGVSVNNAEPLPVPTIDKSRVSSCAFNIDNTQNTMELQIGDGRIVLKMNGDITRESTDFIVNAANEGMLGGGGVDGAITRKGGEELHFFRTLIPEVRPGVRCPTGEARLTDAGCLPASFCIHTVGPRFNSSDRRRCRNQLTNTYASSLNVAQALIDYLRQKRAESARPSTARRRGRSHDQRRQQEIHGDRWSEASGTRSCCGRQARQGRAYFAQFCDSQHWYLRVSARRRMPTVLKGSPGVPPVAPRHSWRQDHPIRLSEGTNRRPLLPGCASQDVPAVAEAHVLNKIAKQSV